MIKSAVQLPSTTHRRVPALQRLAKGLIPANIMLGMPQRNCQYHGICRIDVEDDVESVCPHRVRARLGFDGDQLQVHFEKETMPAATAEKHFACGYFIVLTDFTLPEFLQKYFPAPLIIRRGIYPVRETTAYYIVHF